MGSRTAESRLLQPGHIIGSSDGSAYIITSSIMTGEGFHYRLADLRGRPVYTPAQFDPVPFNHARIGAWLRLLAYNKEFDTYIKAYLQQAGLPIDPSMNWAKYLQTTIGPQLGTFDAEIQDEAIHYIIIKVLSPSTPLASGEVFGRDFLNPSNPHGLQNAIESFKAKARANPEKYKNNINDMPLEKQVTEVLKKHFAWRADEARRYVKEVLQGQDVSEGVEGESFVDINPQEGEEGGGILDMPDQATGTQDFEEAMTDVDMGDFTGRGKNWAKGRFSYGFYQWLLKKFPTPPTARQYMRLLSLLYEETKSYGKMPKLDDIEKRWRFVQNKHETSRNRLDHEGFTDLFKSLPEKIEVYVRTHFHGQESTLPTIVRVLNKFGQEKRRKQLEESDKDRESRRPEKNEEDFITQGDVETPASEGAASNEVPPTARTSAATKQYEAPKCSCGETKDLKTCPTCKKKFCMLCMRDHHANSPGHDKVKK